MTEPRAPGEAPSRVLACENIRVVRGKKTILRGITLGVERGEVLGVLGPSGAGKSTLFRTLVGELPATDGRVMLGEDDVTQWPLWARARAGVAYVPQEPSVLWDLSVRENLVAYHRIVHGKGILRGRVKLAGEDEATESLAKRVALEERLDVRAGSLSGGERRRLELARAITREPRVLVCDEPFAGVDPRQAERLGDMLTELGQSGVTVLLADHHVAEALRVCSRALLVLDGEIAIDATPDAFREDPIVQGRYLGTWRGSLPPPTSRRDSI